MPEILRKIRELRRIGSQFLSGQRLVPIDYSLNPTPRYGFGKPPERSMDTFLNRHRVTYEDMIEECQRHAIQLRSVPFHPSNQAQLPSWKNAFFAGLDALSLFTIISSYKPKTYLEIGSGNSTKFARLAVKKGSLNTKIVSIDPTPRAEIDSICDEVIRKPFEEVDLSLFNGLGKNDIVFYDGSHRTFMNSDVTVFFLEVLPRLPAGVLIHVHDIFLPYDYPPEWEDRFYSEQYLLACYLLADGQRFDVLMPNYYISQDPELSKMLAPVWKSLNLENDYHSGVSFWMIKR